MNQAIVEVLYVVCMLAMSITGAYCAHKLNNLHPCWVRCIVMAPAIVGMFSPILMVRGEYVPYPIDVIFATAVMLLYALVASRFSATPWLDLWKTTRENK